MSLESDNLVAAHVLRKLLGNNQTLVEAKRIIKDLDELGWELREYKYNMTPERWQQMADRQVNP